MPRPRHVIWMTCDHLRWEDLGGNGISFAHTPNIDRLIGDGVSFDHAYCQNPVCMPSRCSFMTGCYPHQVGVTANGQELDPACPLTAPRCFAAGGYQTAQIGKLHLQSHEDMDLDGRARHDYGFDVFWCDEEPGCYDGPYLRWLASEAPAMLPRFRTARPAAPGRDGETKAPQAIDAPWHYSYSGWIAEQTRRYLATWGAGRARDEHHFLHCGFYAPHPPLNPTTDMLAPLAARQPPPARRQPGESADKPEPLCSMLRNPALDEEETAAYRRHFAAMVTGVDFAVGRIVAMLEEAGVLDDTLLVFGSDHGDFCGDHGLVCKNVAWYESVARVPLVLHWPAGLGRGGHRVDGLVELVDVLPTLLGLAGQRPPPSMSGRDWSAELLAGDHAAIGRPDALAVHRPGHLLLRTPTHKYIRYDQGDQPPGEVLYDLRDDPDEFINRAEDPTQEDLLRQLRDRSLQRLIQASEPINPKIYHF